MVPVSWLFCRERDCRLESCVISEGMVPVRDLEVRVIAVTRPEESQLTPCHLQGLLPDQVGGDGVKEADSFIMMAVSSAVVRERVERKRRKMTVTNAIVVVAVVVGSLSSSSSMASSPGERREG